MGWHEGFAVGAPWEPLLETSSGRQLLPGTFWARAPLAVCLCSGHACVCPQEVVEKGLVAALSLLARKGWFLLSLGPLCGVWPWVSAAAGDTELQLNSALQLVCNQ